MKFRSYEMWIFFGVLLVLLIVFGICFLIGGNSKSEYLDVIREDLDAVCEELNIKPKYDIYESQHESFTWGKKAIYIVIRNKNGSYFDLNTIMLASLHELAHILCKEEGHTEEFDQIEYRLQETAHRLGIVDLDQDPDSKYPSRN